MSEPLSVLSAADHALHFAKRIFSKYPNTSESLEWLTLHPEKLNSRIFDFDYVIRKINVLLKDPRATPFEYRIEMQKFVNLAQEKHIPTLIEADLEASQSSPHHSSALKAFTQGKREFGWANEDFDQKLPAKSAMGVLLEGYGRFIGLRQTPDVARAEQIQHAFVEAFEAILLVDLPESALLGDIKDWMKSDAHKFSEPIQRALITPRAE